MRLEEILPALRAGKKVRRVGWLEGYYLNLSGWIHNSLGIPVLRELSSMAILAEDWEVVEPAVTITHSQFAKAWNKIWYNPRARDMSELSAELAKELGLL